jgi:hypothetical protein
MKKISILFAFLIFLSSCEKNSPDVNTLIDEVIKSAGSDNLNNAKVEFVFRDKEYGVLRNGGKFEMVRISQDTLALVRDELSNDGFIRQINGVQVQVADSMAIKYSNSINSVIYFALLPFNLIDPAVIKTYLGEEKIKDILYDKVLVQFTQKDGGKDYEDEFIYWINKEDHLIDYFAYSYKTDGGGMRFREAYNPRIIEDILFVDYINYETEEAVDLQEIGKLFKQNKLKELSRIKLENIKVEKL